MMRWYAVHTQPAAEAKAAEHLSRQGYPTYLPRHRRWIRHARRRELALRPLFPRYLFVGIARALMSWRPVRSTVGVAGLVLSGAEPLAVPPHVVEALRAHERAGDFDELTPTRRLVPGDKVRLSEGPFADFVGRLVSIGSDRRAVVFFEFLGRIVRAEVSGSAVEAA
jgi:transcriptional antiterminator RfaH